MNKPLIYLAGPYTHSDPSVMEERGLKHGEWAGKLLREGLLIYCPIAETEGIAKACHMTGTDWNTWREKDLAQLIRCDQMWVLTLDGWDKSLGVKGEVKFCLNNNIPISLIDVNNEIIYQVEKQDLLNTFKVKTVEELND